MVHPLCKYVIQSMMEIGLCRAIVTVALVFLVPDTGSDHTTNGPRQPKRLRTQDSDSRH